MNKKLVLAFPFCIFPITLLLFGAAYIFSHNIPTDFHLHDTYIVFDIKSLIIYFLAITIFLWLLYVLLNRYFLWRTITWLHIIISIGCLLFIIFLLLQLQIKFNNDAMDTTIKRHYVDTTTTQIYQYIMVTFVITQLLFVINLVAGLFVKRKAILKNSFSS